MNEITHVRGDTEQFAIEFVRDGQPYTPADLASGDIFTLTIRDPYSGVEMLKKQTTYPGLSLNLIHDDTKSIKPGTYRYDLEYSKPDKSVVKTLITGDFKLLRDVTFER